MQLTGDAQADDDDGLAGSNIDETLCVQTGCHDLDQRCGLALDAVRQRKDRFGWCEHVLREAAVPIATQQHARRAEMLATVVAVAASAAVDHGIDDDAGTDADAVGTTDLDDLADHLVPHDARVIDRDAAFENLQIGAAHARVCDPQQGLAFSRMSGGDLLLHQVRGRFQNHGFHRRGRSYRNPC